jgi:hypothetical protein
MEVFFFWAVVEPGWAIFPSSPGETSSVEGRGIQLQAKLAALVFARFSLVETGGDILG